MKNNRRLSAFFSGIAILVAGAGIESSGSSEPLAAPPASTSWATAFPVAQAGFAWHSSGSD